MVSEEKILVVGAGPSGLAAALFLSQEGFRPRVIEKNNGLSEHSKALGVNPRTLQLLEKSGLTQRFLDKGRKMEKINFWHHDQLIFQNDFSKVHHQFPFMLIQPQKDSEQLLLEELDRRKIPVEFGTSFESLDHVEDQVKAAIASFNGNMAEQDFDLVIGADGARSRVRESSGIEMAGFRYQEEWELYDVELDVPRANDEGHVLIMKAGGMVMIRLEENIWRVAGNMHALLNHLPKNTRVGQVIWQSKFKISHQVAIDLYRDNVLIIGDAAHLHSPVGARGMNLGIEDAYLVSQLIKENRIREYTKVRRDYLKRTVRRVNVMTRALAGNGFLLQKARANMGFFKPLFPLVMPTARKFILGLNK